MAANAQRKIATETRSAGELKPDPKNARRHSEAQIARIAQSIERFGYVQKIVVRPDGQIVGGHATFEALKRLGQDKIECTVVHGLSSAQYTALALALNKLPEGSSWDSAMLADVLGELDEAGEDAQALGFSEKELKQLAEDDDEIEVKELATTPVDDQFWISVRGPLKHQAAALKALEAAMKPFGDVTVDLGTVPVEDL